MFIMIYHTGKFFSNFNSRNGSFARSYPNLAISGSSSNPASPKKTANVNAQQIRLHHEVVGDIVCPSMVLGMNYEKSNFKL